MTVTRTAGPLLDGHPDPRQGRRGQSRRHGTGFWIAGYAFAVTMAFSTVPAPLYVLYQARDRFGSLLVTVIFAAYAVGVVASLFLLGHLSDWLGRRRIALIALGISMLAGVTFLAWPEVPGRETLAGLFLAAYVGLAVPVLGLGVATQLLSAQVSVLGFAAVLLVIAAVLLVIVAVLLVIVAVVARRLRAGRNRGPDGSVQTGRVPSAVSR